MKKTNFFNIFNFKNLTIGRKIFTALTIILVLFVAMEGVVFLNLENVVKSSDDMKDVYLKSTETVIEIENNINEAVQNVEHYNQYGDEAYISKVKEIFAETKIELENAIAYAKLTDKIDEDKLVEVKSMILEYEKLIDESLEVNQSIDVTLGRMIAAAGYFSETSEGYVKAKKDGLNDKISLGFSLEYLTDDIVKIDQGTILKETLYRIRLDFAKYVADGNQSNINNTFIEFDEIDAVIGSLMESESEQSQIDMLKAISEAAGSYKTEITNFQNQKNQLSQYELQMDTMGVQLGGIEAEISQENFLAMETAAGENVGHIAKTVTMLIGGLLLFIIIALSFFIPITRNITKSIHKIIYMIKEMRLGHYSERLEIDSKDEIGQMSEELNEYFEGNQKYLLANLNKLASGDMDIEVHVADDRDERGPAIVKTRDAINELLNETQTLIQASIEGNLDKRGDVSKFEGGYKGLIQGINAILDAVIDPIKEVSDVLEEMEKGNLNVQVTGNYKGDHARIKNALNDTINIIRGYVGEISTVLSEMADGNMNHSVNGEYRGDFSSIKVALNTIVDSLNDVLGEMNNSSEQVASGSRQVSDGSQELSQGATEQASSLEELNASITEIAAQTKQNAANAEEANKITEEVRINASSGNKQMSEMLYSMKDINESSGNISKIIKVIDDIAFQTNLLALNAAVEAARAGQHGRGFAVVAEEVRNLAARSADAAKETTVMIEGSIKKVEAGTTIANDTAKALEDIVKGVEKAADLVSEISGASNEQAAAVTQINEGLIQVSRVVQSNSSTAEESAAASEELSSQAELLKNMVSKFKLRGDIAAFNSSVSRQNYKSKLDNVYREAEDIIINLDDREFGKY